MYTYKFINKQYIRRVYLISPVALLVSRASAIIGHVTEDDMTSQNAGHCLKVDGKIKLKW